MKVYILSLFITTCILLSVSAQNNYKPAQSSFRFGTGYSKYSESGGFIVFNEIQFHICNRFTAGPGFYFSRNGYYLGGKNDISHIYGVDLNLYYHIPICKSSTIQLGPGYTFRHVENPNYLEYDEWVKGNDYNNESQFIANMNIEKGISDRWTIGFKSSWQPFGRLEYMFYGGIYGGLKF